jgi:hypothetical protein
LPQAFTIWGGTDGARVGTKPEQPVRIKVEKTMETMGQIERFLFMTSPQTNMDSLAIQHEATPISTLRQLVSNICGHNPSQSSHSVKKTGDKKV